MTFARSFAIGSLVTLVLAAGCGDSSSKGDATSNARARCGDGHCDASESRLTCPGDCALANGGASGSAGRGGGTSGDAADKGGKSGAGKGGAAEHAGRGGATSAGRGGSHAGGMASGKAQAGEAGEAGAGTAGDSGEPVDHHLGAQCASASDCDAGLDCMTSDFFDGAGPAQGVCTLECADDGACQAVSSHAHCLSLGAGINYCFEGCEGGDTATPKCHGRAEVACSIVGLTPTAAGCTDTSDCEPAQLCDGTGKCNDMVLACSPSCGSDVHCASGQFCDLSSGFCFSEAPTGLAIGSACTPPAGDGPDPCDGVCSQLFSAATECTATCPLGSSSSCGWNGSGPADAACLLSTVVTPPDAAGFGDEGFCAPLCDCNDDCKLPGDRCVGAGHDLIAKIWHRNGYCRPLLEGESESQTLSECTFMGAGGAGGAAGAAGTGGNGPG